MIVAAADEALEPGRNAQLEAHVKTCASCRTALADQRLVRAVLASTPPAVPPPDFLARVNAQIDDESTWVGLTDFRVWTLRLATAAVALALFGWLGILAEQPVRYTRFSPASATDWQRDVPADALLDAALRTSARGSDVR